MATVDLHTAIAALREVKSAPLQPIAKAFELNMRRTYAFSVLPSELIYCTKRDTLTKANAVFRSSGRSDFNVFNLDAETEQQSDKLAPHIKDQKDAYTSMAGDHITETRLSVGASAVESMLVENRGMRGCIDALLTSITLESWLFFEAMAADAWVAAVDAGGPLIMARMLANQRWEKDKDGMRAGNVPAMGVNPKTHPGSFWRSAGMVSFQKLALIRTYYAIAFGNDVADLIDKTDEGYIYALNAVRNCIVHSAGKADQKFVERAKRFPELASIRLCDKILLDGELVNRLRNSSLSVGFALLSALDEKLQRGD